MPPFMVCADYEENFGGTYFADSGRGRLTGNAVTMKIQHYLYLRVLFQHPFNAGPGFLIGRVAGNVVYFLMVQHRNAIIALQQFSKLFAQGNHGQLRIGGKGLAGYRNK